MVRTSGIAMLLVGFAGGTSALSGQNPGSLGASVVDSLAAAGVSAGFEDPVVIQPLPDQVMLHLDHLLTTFSDTPGGMGLIDTGMAEAGIAAEYVRIAGEDSLDLSNMTRNMTHVIHAIDPTVVPSGQGLGYGFKRAAQGVATHAELAMAVENVNDNFLFHAPYMVAAARGAVRRADEAIGLARRVESSTDPQAALRLINRLAVLVRAMAYGSDADDDGRIGYDEGEFGLAQARYHLDTVRRYQGIPIR